MAGLMLEITSPNWNLNCISDNLLSPNQNKQKHHTYCLGQQVHSNTICPLQRAIYLILERREVGGGGGAERIFVYMTEDWMQVTWKRMGTRMSILTPNWGPLWPPIHTSS